MRRFVLPLAAFALLGLCAPSRADRVDLHVPLGTSAQATIEQPGQLVTAAFLVHAGAKKNVSIAVKRAKRSDLALDVRLLSPDGDEFNFAADSGAKEKAKDKSYKAKLKSIAQGGMWRIEVRGIGASTGDFIIALKGKDNDSLGGTDVVGVGGRLDVPFNAADGGEVTVQVKRSRGSALIPDVVIVDPNGADVSESVGAAAVSTKSGKATLKKFVVPLFGRFTVRITGSDGSGGGLSYKIKAKPHKFKGTLPIADPGASFDVEPGTSGRLDGSSSTGSGTLSYLWAQVHGDPVAVDDPTADMPGFTAPDADTTLAYQLSVFNGVRSRPRLVAVEVAERPIAIPGRSQVVAPSAIVTVDATESLDFRGAGLRTTWRVIEGGVTLNDAAAEVTTFTAPASGVVRLGLVVDDGRTVSQETEHVIVVSGGPASVADAGRPQRVSRMATVHLSGLASQRSTGSFGSGAAWTQVHGPAVDLSDDGAYFPSFTAPRQPADLAFTLTVDGQTNASHTAWVFVRDSATGTAPAAAVPPAATPSAGSILLSATGTTDPDGDSTFVRWAATGGTAVTIADATAKQTSASGLTAPDVVWTFVVQARDNEAYGPPNHVRASNPGYTATPLANAGIDRTISGSQFVNLDGSQSTDPTGGGSLTFVWTQVSGTDWYDVAAEDAGFDRFTAQPGFSLPPDLSSLTTSRTITFALVATSGAISSPPDLVTLSFVGLPVNGAPVVTADSSNTSPLTGELVTLMGTANDRDGDPVTVSWSQVSGPPVSLTPSGGVLSPSFTAPSAGTMVFRIVGNDTFEDSSPADVTVTVNEAPVAVPTATPQQGDPGTLVTIDGSGSSDPEGQLLTYSWEQTAGTLINFDSTAESFQFNAPGGVLTFRLTVNDGEQDSLPVTVGFGSTPPPVVAPTASLTQAAYGASVSLSANPANNDRNGVTFTWRQISGPSTTLSSTTTENPTFTVPLPSAAPFGGTSSSLPTARFGVKSTRQGQDSAEVAIDVRYFASYNNTTQTSASNTVWGIISTNCVSCHSTTVNNCSNGGARKYGINGTGPLRTNSINTAACSSVKSYVVPGSPGSSFTLDRLKGVGVQGTMPPGGSLGTLRINLIEDWINQGAQAN